MCLLWLRQLPQCGDWTLASVPPLAEGPVLLTLPFLPLVALSYRVLHGSIYSFQRRQWHPLQHSCLENPMDGGAWWATVHGVAKSRTQLSDFTFTFHFHASEKEMATPLQCFCLENPRDGGAWWAAVYRVAQSRTQLKRLGGSSSSICSFHWSGTPVHSQLEFCMHFCV